MKKFMGWNSESFDQHKYIIRGKDNLDTPTTGSKTAYSRMTTKLDSTVHRQFDRLDVRWIFLFAENHLFFGI